MATTFTDGDWTSAEAEGPPIVSFPLQAQGDTYARMVSRRYTQDARYYSGPSMGSRYPFNDIPNRRSLRMTSHADPEYLGATMVAFTVVWHDVPQNRIDMEGTTFNYQFPYQDGDGLPTIAEIGIRVTARVRISYIHTSNPAKIEIRQPYRFVRFGNGIVNFGLESTDGDGYILAEPTDVRRWNGDIWEVREMYVPKRELGGSTSYISTT